VSGARRPRPPKGDAWVKQIFDKQALLNPSGVVFRSVSSVLRHASEELLLHHAEKRRFTVTRMGTHYLIHRPLVSPRRIYF
jgi:hypothetical protein